MRAQQVLGARIPSSSGTASPDAAAAAQEGPGGASSDAVAASAAGPSTSGRGSGSGVGMLQLEDLAALVAQGSKLSLRMERMVAAQKLLDAANAWARHAGASCCCSNSSRTRRPLSSSLPGVLRVQVAAWSGWYR